MLQRVYRDVTGALKGVLGSLCCFKGMSQECYKGVARVFTVLKGSKKDVRGMLGVCCSTNAWVLQGITWVKDDS